MPKILVVVDGKEQAVAAITHIVEMHLRDAGTQGRQPAPNADTRAGTPPSPELYCPADDHILILNIHPPRQSWQKRNKPRQLLDRELQRQAALMRNATAPWLQEAGIEYETRNCFGNVPQTVSKLAVDENCDEIVVVEPEHGRLARWLERTIGLRPASYVDRIIPAAPVPVIIVGKDSLARNAT